MYLVWAGLNSAGLKRLRDVGRLDLDARLEHDRHALDAELVRLLRVGQDHVGSQQPHRHRSCRWSSDRRRQDTSPS